MAADPNSEKPDVESGKADAVEPPEIEAEIVDAEFSDEPEGKSVDSEDAVAAETAPEKGDQSFLRGKLSPRIITVLIAGGALVVVLGLWLLQPRKAPPPSVAHEVETAATPEGDAAPTPEAPSDVTSRAAPDPGKIANSGMTAAKTASDEVEPAAADKSARGLPAPPPPSSGNENLQRAAKDAVRSLGGGSGEVVPEEHIDLAPADPAVGADETLKQLQEEASAQTAVEEAGGFAESVASPPGAPEGDVASVKIGNDLEELKALFQSETARLSSELARERARANQQSSEIASLRESLNQTLSARANQSGAEIDDLRAQVDKIRSERSEVAIGRQAAASFAIVALHQAIDDGAPYTNELDTIAAFAPGAGGIDTLRAYSESGVPTLGALRMSFQPAIRSALAAARREQAKGPFSALAAGLQGMISVRPAEPQPGQRPSAVISRAEARLGDDDLAGAVNELKGLDGAALKAAGPWLDDAGKRLAAQAALARLRTAYVNPNQN